MKTIAILVASAVALSACSSPPPARYAVPAIEIETRQSMRFASLEVLEVSLPRFAATEAILIQRDRGALEEDTSAIWADDPPRAITLELVRHIGTITSRKVASSPWPFREPAAARLELRIEDLTADPNGTLRMSGQYFVATEDGVGDRAHRFSLSEPWQTAGGLRSLAEARARMVARLAGEIVGRGLR